MRQDRHPRRDDALALGSAMKTAAHAGEHAEAVVRMGSCDHSIMSMMRSRRHEPPGELMIIWMQSTVW